MSGVLVANQGMYVVKDQHLPLFTQPMPIPCQARGTDFREKEEGREESASALQRASVFEAAGSRTLGAMVC